MNNPPPGLELLRESNPWPDERPDSPATSWGWGIDGEGLLLARLPEDASCILEIGTLFGASARFFAEARPNATVICIDPWNDMENRPLLKHKPELAPYLNDREDGLYHMFLASQWNLRERMIPLRGCSPERLKDIYDFGIRPDFVYVDGAHNYENVLIDLTTCHLLFPEAVLTGDDWRLDSVNRAVCHFAERRGLKIETVGNTFALRATRTPGRSEEPIPEASVYLPQSWRAKFLGPLRRICERFSR